MAFGDKVSWHDAYKSRFEPITTTEVVVTELQPPAPDKTYSFKDVNGAVKDGGIIEFGVPLPEVKQHKTTTAPVACCFDAFNLSIVHNVGTPFCLKCRKELSIEHFKTVLGIK